MSDMVQTNASAPKELQAAPGPTTPLGEVGIAKGLQFRVDERYEVEGDAEVIVRNDVLGSSVLRGRILDISASGCYIQSVARAPIKPGTEVHLDFTIYGTTFRVDAVSRFAKTRVGIGFRFIELDTATRNRLRSVLSDIRSKHIKAQKGSSRTIVDRTVP